MLKFLASEILFKGNFWLQEFFLGNLTGPRIFPEDLSLKFLAPGIFLGDFSDLEFFCQEFLAPGIFFLRNFASRNFFREFNGSRIFFEDFFLKFLASGIFLGDFRLQEFFFPEKFFLHFHQNSVFFFFFILPAPLTLSKNEFTSKIIPLKKILRKKI